MMKQSTLPPTLNKITLRLKPSKYIHQFILNRTSIETCSSSDIGDYSQMLQRRSSSFFGFSWDVEALVGLAELRMLQQRILRVLDKNID